MTRVLTVVGLLLSAVAITGEPAKPAAVVFEGKVQTVAKVLERQGVKADPDTAGVALVTAGGTAHTVVKNDASRLLFLDPELHDRPVRLTARVVAGTQMLAVEKVQTVKGEKAFDVDYWCENCQMSYAEPGKCICCGGDTVRRERPAK